MGSDQGFVDFVCEQSDLGDALSYRKMFGEYALYLQGKVVALICDNQLFLKPTDQGRDILGRVDEQPPYPGAKPHFLLSEALDDRGRLKQVLLITADALPKPKPKPKKPRKKKSS